MNTECKKCPLTKTVHVAEIAGLYDNPSDMPASILRGNIRWIRNHRIRPQQAVRAIRFWNRELRRRGLKPE